MNVKKNNWLAVFLVLMFASYLYAQTELENQFKLAKHLYSEEEYFDSITELKRLLFFDSAHVYAFEANYLIAKAYKMGAKFSDAVHYFTLAQINARSPDELFRTNIDIIRVNILRRTTNRALYLITLLEADKRFAEKKVQIDYWRGWAYIFADQWSKAALEFERADSAKLLAEYCKKVESEKYSVSLAKTISHFIPGAGQFYTGNYLSGVISLTWNLIWGYTAVNAFIEDRIFDGIMTANFLWLRFYIGNLKNAEKFAEKKNLEISNRMLNYLQFDFKGVKP